MSDLSARVVQFIGRNHNWDVCESDCTAAEHAWHFVRAEAVHKGSTRKFVDLKIDLHTSLRCAELEGLLRLIKDKLQVEFPMPTLLGLHNQSSSTSTRGHIPCSAGCLATP